MIYEVFISGAPKGQGSLIPISNPVTGKLGVKHYPKTIEHRNQIVGALRGWWELKAPIDRALVVDLEFDMPRPKHHWGAKGLRPSSPRQCVTAPDLDKMIRLILDALTISGVIVDDSFVVGINAIKRYSDEKPIGTNIRLMEVTDGNHVS